MTETTGPQLMGTGEAARALGVDRRTLSRWAQTGRITPDAKTIGGFLRWDLDRLRVQLQALGAIPPGSTE